MANSKAIIIGAILIAGVILIVFRWSIVPGPALGWAYRLDHWSGEVTSCTLNTAKTFDCAPK